MDSIVGGGEFDMGTTSEGRQHGIQENNELEDVMNEERGSEINN